MAVDVLTAVPVLRFHKLHLFWGSRVLRTIQTKLAITYGSAGRRALCLSKLERSDHRTV